MKITINGDTEKVHDLILFDVSQNNLSGCFHLLLTESLCRFPNSVINTGNSFISEWSDACNCGVGTCPCANVNEWISSNNSWDKRYSWSLNHIPLVISKLLTSY